MWRELFVKLQHLCAFGLEVKAFWYLCFLTVCLQNWIQKQISSWGMDKVSVRQSQCTERNSSLFCIYRNAVDGNKKLYAIYDTR